MQNTNILNSSLFSAPKSIKNLIIDPILTIERDLIYQKKQINEATFKKNDISQLQSEQEEMINNLEEKYQQLQNCMKEVIQKFLVYENKNFIRLNENYYGRNERIKKIVKELAKMFHLGFLELDDCKRDLVIYKNYDPELFPLKPRQQREKRGDKKIGDIEELFKQIKVSDDIDPIPIANQPLPPDVIREIHIKNDPSKVHTIIISFNKPNDFGQEITLYRIYQLDIYDKSLSLQPAKRVVIEFENNKEQVQIQRLSFTQNNPLNVGQLPFNEMIYLSIEAQNINGWSSEQELIPIKLYVKYQQPLSLYLQGTINSILIDDSINFLELFQIPQIIKEENKKYLQIEDYSLVLLEKEQIRNVSIKKDTVGIVNSKFQACQWGSILNFFDENITQHFDVDPLKDFDISPPYHINTDKAISKIACGIYHSLALTVDGNVISWGYNKHGQLGNGMTISSIWPQQLSYFKNNQIFVVDIAAGEEISICRTDQGDVYTWGKMQNNFGDNIIKVLNAQKEAINLQCVEQSNSQLVPRKINLKAKQIQAGYSSFGALSIENYLYMWGCNEHEVFGFLKCPELDDQIIIHLLDPIRINIDSNFEIQDFQLGAYHCVTKVINKTNGQEQYLSWGYNKYNQCGQFGSNKQGAINCKKNMIDVLPQKKFKSYSCGFDRTIFASFDNHIYTLSKNDTRNNDCSVFVEQVLAGDLINLVLGKE
ncbi:unnamed protein product [Paramecium sonneborni]|uniref:Regulator of chromosome condensation 1/beta-lactamase-inhibitor protein II n=1 Tax=Paramecium sonneborni TaxID=65129 RepID=A0A8S1NSD4_9CILI|nr:unnamed protein product [Paramecium sonneborni]